jgi:hypothetical protein
LAGVSVNGFGLCLQGCIADLFRSRVATGIIDGIIQQYLGF